MTAPLIFLESKDTFRSAILGVVYKSADQAAVCYSVDLIISALVEHDGWTLDEAQEWFEYNIVSLEDMEGGPVFVYQSDHYLVDLESGESK
tara:strand:- start:391 stop:663 length:273 start_codon:yes stop_codon:yes gene_type:complete